MGLSPRQTPAASGAGDFWGDRLPYTCFLCSEYNEVENETVFPETCFYFPPKEHAFESSQKYKEGKFIIELAHMIKDNGWE